MRIPAVLALLLLVPASCSKKYDKETDDPGLTASGADEPTEKAPPVKPMPAPKKKALTPEELGTCTLKATGAITKEQTTPGGRAATNVSYWMKDDERKNMMGTDGFAVNCQGPEIKFSLIPGGKKDGMPFKPKKYTFTKGTGDASVMAIFGKNTLDNISGTVDVTAFDAHHIAGAVDLKGKLVPGGGEVKLTGNFDLICPGFGGCAE
jgi:hypothetical protein